MRRIVVQRQPMDPNKFGKMQMDTFKVRVMSGVFMTFLTIVCLATGMLGIFRLRSESAYDVTMKLLEAQSIFPFR